MITVRRAETGDAAAVAEIYNQGIADRLATFETERRQPDQLAERISDHAHPFVVAEGDGRLVGWAAAGTYRPRTCYAGVGEFSVYVARGERGRGVGRALLQALIAEAERLGFWKLVSRVFSFNTASRALCRACGFREVGVYEKHGRLDGRWVDCVIVERLLMGRDAGDGDRQDPTAEVGGIRRPRRELTNSMPLPAES